MQSQRQNTEILLKLITAPDCIRWHCCWSGHSMQGEDGRCAFRGCHTFNCLFRCRIIMMSSSLEVLYSNTPLSRDFWPSRSSHWIHPSSSNLQPTAQSQHGSFRTHAGCLSAGSKVRGQQRLYKSSSQDPSRQSVTLAR